MKPIFGKAYDSVKKPLARVPLSKGRDSFLPKIKKPVYKMSLASRKAPAGSFSRLAGSFKKGGPVNKTGVYKLHKGERVLNVKQTQKFTKEPYKTKTPLGKKSNLVAKPKGKMLPRVAPKKQPKLSQRDMYAKAMNKAQKNGGSNGIGVGY